MSLVTLEKSVPNTIQYNDFSRFTVNGKHGSASHGDDSQNVLYDDRPVSLDEMQYQRHSSRQKIRIFITCTGSGNTR
jgi:hypothetical protein